MPQKKSGWRVDVIVSLKPSVLDPQGATVQQALVSMGFQGVNNVRLGKHCRLDFSGRISRPEVERQVKQMCAKLLANPVIETYHYEIHENKVAA